MKRLLVALMATGVFLSLGPVALAEETVCKGTIGGKTVDNVKVPQDATCVLDGTKVKGTVKVNRNAVTCSARRTIPSRRVAATKWAATKRTSARTCSDSPGVLTRHPENRRVPPPASGYHRCGR